MRQLVIHYESSAREVVAPIYRQFLRALDPDVTVFAVCPDRSAFADLSATVLPVRCKLLPVIVGHPITAWSRDRWVALAPASRSGPTTLWVPRGEAAGEIWPARAGDEQVGADLAWQLRVHLSERRSDFYFDGGDFLADSETVFVVGRVLQRNLEQTVRTRGYFLQQLSRELKRRVILLEPSPDHHAGMFMASLGGRRMLVGDPSLARQWLPENIEESGRGEFMQLPGGPDFTPATQGLFDAVARQCTTAGYQVFRIPVLPARDGRTYLTYLNVMLDHLGAQNVVYLPVYRGVEPLNAAAREVWQQLGYQVRPIDCTTTYRYFGCLHCLVNVLQRDSASSQSAWVRKSPQE